MASKQIININPITITIPLGETITRGSFPKTLYVNYNQAPYHGYIQMPTPLEDYLIVLNPRTVTGGGVSVPAVTPTTGAPAPIEFQPNTNQPSDIAINIPTDAQQEILIKGAIKNIVTNADGFSNEGEPMVFYISILVGGIDWRPASRFPSELDLLDWNDGFMKEPITTADIPAVDAYQYLISLQVRSQAEDYQLESLKQTLARKMILARDINYAFACILAIERAYYDILERLKDAENNIKIIYQILEQFEAWIFTLELDIDSLFDNLVLNWKKTHEGLYAARHDAYWRVYHSLRHYGSFLTNPPTDALIPGSTRTTSWGCVPIFGVDTDTRYDGSFSAPIPDDNGVNSSTNDTGGIGPTPVIVVKTDSGTTTVTLRKSLRPVRKVIGDFNSFVFSHKPSRWTTEKWDDKTQSGNAYVNTDDKFHNITVTGHGNAKGGVILNVDQIGYYSHIEDFASDIDSSLSSDYEGQKALFKVHKLGTTGVRTTWYQDNAALRVTDRMMTFRLGKVGQRGYAEMSHRTAEQGVPYVYFGSRNALGGTGDAVRSAGLVLHNIDERMANGPKTQMFLVAKRIHLADVAGREQYINFTRGTVGGSGGNYITMNIGNGSGSPANESDGFHITKHKTNVMMEYEGNAPGKDNGKRYCGISFSMDGLHLYGLSMSTLGQLVKIMEENIKTPEKFLLAVYTKGSNKDFGSILYDGEDTSPININAGDPPDGWVFEKWEERRGGGAIASATSASTTWTPPNPPANGLVEAIWKEQTYSLTVTPVGNGTVSPTTKVAQKDESIVISATPVNGNEVQEWKLLTGTGVLYPNGPSNATSGGYTMGAEDAKVEIVFKVSNTDLVVKSQTGGTVTGTYTGGSISVAAGASNNYPVQLGTAVNLIATANTASGYIFEGWNTSGLPGVVHNNASPFNFTMPNNATSPSVEAKFKLDSGNFVVTIGTGVQLDGTNNKVGTNNVTGSGGTFSIINNTAVNITVKPQSGFDIASIKWTGTGLTPGVPANGITSYSGNTTGNTGTISVSATEQQYTVKITGAGSLKYNSTTGTSFTVPKNTQLEASVPVRGTQYGSEYTTNRLDTDVWTKTPNIGTFTPATIVANETNPPTNMTVQYTTPSTAGNDIITLTPHTRIHTYSSSASISPAISVLSILDKYKNTASLWLQGNPLSSGISDAMRDRILFLWWSIGAAVGYFTYFSDGNTKAFNGTETPGGMISWKKLGDPGNENTSSLGKGLDYTNFDIWLAEVLNGNLKVKGNWELPILDR